MAERPKFDETVEAQLLANGFVPPSDDWPWGPQCFDFNLGWDHLSMQLMKNDYGYDVIIGLHQSGTNPRMNIGVLNSAKQILDLKKAMEELW